MPGLHDEQYDFLRQLSTHQLEALLRADFEEYEQNGQSNDELVEKILEVIEQREKEQPSKRYGDVDAAWERFARDTAAAPTSSNLVSDEKPFNGTANSSKPRRVNHSFRRFGLVAAAITLCSVCAACAIQFNLFEMVGRWTAEIFNFRSVTTDNNPEIQVSEAPANAYAPLGKVLADHGVSVKLPTKAPDGYEPQETTVLELREPVFSSVYRPADQQGVFAITVVVHATTNFEGVETNEFLEEYLSHGQTYTLLTNHEQVVATWYQENIELSIRGTITVEEMKAVIDSI